MFWQLNSIKAVDSLRVNLEVLTIVFLIGADLGFKLKKLAMDIGFNLRFSRDVQ